MIVIAIDWSGATDGASRTWLAEVDTSDGEVKRLEAGRNRTALADHLIELAWRTPEMIVGIDFAFSLPQWFARERGIANGPALWDLVASEAESWLRECAPPFWGRPGKTRPEMEKHFRRTDADVPAIGGIRPKSVFQIGGAGAVGTGSLRGIPLLKRLRDRGFSIWPFDAPTFPVVVEIYPRALTGPVNKSNQSERLAYLNEHYPSIDNRFRLDAAASEDAFDALVSGLVMADHASKLMALEPARDDVDRLEGRIWLPSAIKSRITRRQTEDRSSPSRNGDIPAKQCADVDRVPTISEFYGIIIRMHWRDHAPPHFHAEYDEHEAVIGIESSDVLDGSLPRTALKLVLEWAKTNRELLRENWDLCATKTLPKKIPPLE